MNDDDAAGGPAATALIAEDEPLLADALRLELARAWPRLRVLATVGDGVSAVARALELRPDVLFFDIRMPALGGLDAAAELADAWDDDADAARATAPFPALVFVTAYDEYAIAAFETRAIDYLLKPVQPVRLHKSVQKVQQALVRRSSDATFFEATIERLGALLAAASAAPGAQPQPQPVAPPLRMIQAGIGNQIRMLPIDDVLALEAADKYLRVLTAEHGEALIRTPLKDLLPRLDAQQFWRIHRGTVVRASAIDSVQRDDAGRLSLRLRGRGERFAVSRVYAYLFKAM